MMMTTTSWTERVGLTKKFLGYYENLNQQAKRRTDRVGYVQRKLGCPRPEAAGLVDAVDQEAKRAATFAAVEAALRLGRERKARELSGMAT